MSYFAIAQIIADFLMFGMILGNSVGITRLSETDEFLIKEVDEMNDHMALHSAIELHAAQPAGGEQY